MYGKYGRVYNTVHKCYVPNKCLLFARRVHVTPQESSSISASQLPMKCATIHYIISSLHSRTRALAHTSKCTYEEKYVHTIPVPSSNKYLQNRPNKIKLYNQIHA